MKNSALNWISTMNSFIISHIFEITWDYSSTHLEVWWTFTLSGEESKSSSQTIRFCLWHQYHFLYFITYFQMFTKLSSNLYSSQEIQFNYISDHESFFIRVSAFNSLNNTNSSRSPNYNIQILFDWEKLKHNFIHIR